MKLYDLLTFLTKKTNAIVVTVDNQYVMGDVPIDLLQNDIQCVEVKYGVMYIYIF